MKIHKTIRMVGALLLFTVAVQADWNPGDPYKMHYPQLPDPQGWDVAFGDTTLADDFKCTESGEITDVHFWVSWNYDDVMWETVRNIHLSIHSDNPEGPFGWSQPDPKWIDENPARMTGFLWIVDRHVFPKYHESQRERKPSFNSTRATHRRYRRNTPLFSRHR